MPRESAAVAPRYSFSYLLTLVGWVSLAAIIGTGSAIGATKDGLAPIGIGAAESKFICRQTGPELVIDNQRLANWLNIRNEIIGPDEKPDIVAALSAEPAAGMPVPTAWKSLPVKTQQQLKSVQQLVRADVTASDGPFVATGPGEFDIANYFAQKDTTQPWKIVCKPASAEARAFTSKSTVPSDFANVRIRGVPDTIAIDRGDDAAFAAADKATVSLSNDGIKKTQTLAVQATVAYALSDNKNVPFVIYVSDDKNATTTGHAAAKVSKDYVDTGFLIGLNSDVNDYFAAPIAFGVPQQGYNMFSATPGFLFNNVDQSKLLHVHFADVPVVTLPGLGRKINDCMLGCDKGAPFEVVSTFDIRGDVGYYADRGTAPAANKSYGQIGTQLGVVISISPLAVSPLTSDISVTELYLRGTSSARRETDDFEANWTINLVPKFIGLQFSYKNGTLEATGQRENSWMISLAAKY